MESISKFLAADFNGYGNGNGYGDGNGNGYGDGLGNGNGDGLGYGYGNGRGNGNGYGYGDGAGAGCGFGFGNGNGYGDGNGNGEGNGIAEINGHPVYEIDGMPTIIASVRGNLARGYILRHNVKLEPCYVAKVHGYFAHGKTAHEAYADALAKWELDRPLEERITDVLKEYPTLDTKVPNSKLYDIHGKLTGSCRFGRDEFAKAHDIDVEFGSMTMREFIKLTEDAYGGKEIKALKEAYETK